MGLIFMREAENITPQLMGGVVFAVGENFSASISCKISGLDTQTVFYL